MKIRSITAPNPGALTLEGTRSWLLGESAVIDPGPEIDAHVAAIRDAMPRLQTILVTHRHRDHAPAAIPLKAMTGARILAPLGVLDDRDVDGRVAGGETIAVEGESLEVIATPGHTAEHVCYLTTAGDLFTGDTILGAGTTAIFPPDGNMADYLRSLAALRERRPRRILPAHGPERDDAVELIEQYIAHRLERESQIVAFLRASPRTIGELRAAVYGTLDPRVRIAAEAQLNAHLIKLTDEGVVVRSDARFALSARA